MTRRHPNVVNTTEIEPITREHGARFGFTSYRLGTATGATGIGCSLYEVPPGRTAFPHHYHCANEEAIYVLEGSGKLRFGDDELELGTGDYATFPVGPESAHQLINTGDGPLRYLCLSTMASVEVAGYPDSGKIAALAWPPGADFSVAPWAAKWYPDGSDVDYYHGEDTD